MPEGKFYTGYQQGYTSLPGSAIKATWAGREIGTLQGITVSISAEKAPLYVMGHQTARGFTTNKIGIAGSAVFLNMDRDALWEQVNDPRNAIVSISRTGFKLPTDDSGQAQRQLASPGQAPNIEALRQTIGSEVTRQQEELERIQPLYAAQLKGFDVVLTGITAEGRGAFKAIRGIELINEGFASTIDDGTLEAQYTFVAREVTRWTPIFTTGVNTESERVSQFSVQ